MDIITRHARIIAFGLCQVVEINQVAFNAAKIFSLWLHLPLLDVAMVGHLLPTGHWSHRGAAGHSGAETDNLCSGRSNYQYKVPDTSNSPGVCPHS